MSMGVGRGGAGFSYMVLIETGLMVFFFVGPPGIFSADALVYECQENEPDLLRVINYPKVLH